VSIVIPTYNQNPNYLKEAVESALSQSYENIEVVVSNNHSTNETLDVLSDFQDRRLRIVQPVRHLPMMENFTFAGDQATGEFISFLSSDDWVAEDWLQELMPILVKYSHLVFGFGEIADVAHDDLRKVNFLYRDHRLSTGAYSVEQLLPIMFRFDRQSSWMVGDVIRASAYHKVGGIGFGGFKYSSDWGLAVRLLELGGGAYLNKVVARYRSWGHIEGKVDSIRVVGAVEDIVLAYKILEESMSLRPILSSLVGELDAAKRSKARTLVLGVLEALALSGLDEKTLHRLKANLTSLDPSLAMQLFLIACRPAMAPFLRTIYPYCRTAYRSTLGRHLRGRRFRRH
jgi:hypothetical protein